MLAVAIFPLPAIATKLPGHVMLAFFVCFGLPVTSEYHALFVSSATPPSVHVLILALVCCLSSVASGCHTLLVGSAAFASVHAPLPSSAAC